MHDGLLTRGSALSDQTDQRRQYDYIYVYVYMYVYVYAVDQAVLDTANKLIRVFLHAR